MGRGMGMGRGRGMTPAASCALRIGCATDLAHPWQQKLPIFQGQGTRTRTREMVGPNPPPPPPGRLCPTSPPPHHLHAPLAAAALPAQATALEGAA